MQRKTIRVLLIEDSPDYAELVQTWLSPSGEITFALNWTDSLDAGLERLRLGGVDVIFLDLGLPDSNGLETLTKTGAQAPDVPVIVLSAGDSESLALQMIQEGAEDYLVKSTCNRELLIRALQYALVRHRQAARSVSEASLDQRVIGVIGAKGGVGTTTIACTLAAELHHQTGKKVLLADVDIHAGTTSFLMNVDDKYSVLDAISLLDDLDHLSWEELVMNAADGLHVLPSPVLLGTGDLQTAQVRQVLTLVRPMYDWMVLDLGRLNVLSRAILDMVNQVFVVTTIGISALYEAKRVIDALVRAGVEGDRLRLIVNEVEETHTFSGRQLNQVFGTEVYARLPRDSEELHKACVLRRLPGEDSGFRNQIAALARSMAGLPEKKARLALQPLLSVFTGRFRKSANADSKLLD